MNLIKLSQFTFDQKRFVAMGKSTLPLTNLTQETYVLSIWLVDVESPINIPYATAEERDSDMEVITAHLILVT